MDRNSNKTEALWPILTADDRSPFPSAAVGLVNIAAVVLIAVPFFVVLAAAGVGMEGVNLIRDWLATHVTSNAMSLAIGGNIAKIFVGLLAARMEWVLLGLIPWAVREARTAFFQAVSDTF
ncbi:hypothetical protein [Paraburkholderia youngii]|uniref:hypothetical protein n=1 Tax=Paraburkholderia youngii TaxID=2782701 RepID=UPI003D24318A